MRRHEAEGPDRDDERPSHDEVGRRRGISMAQGVGQVFLPDRLRSGGRSAGEKVRRTGADPEGAALVRIRPGRLVWWRGWSSGSVTIG